MTFNYKDTRLVMKLDFWTNHLTCQYYIVYRNISILGILAFNIIFTSKVKRYIHFSVVILTILTKDADQNTATINVPPLASILNNGHLWCYTYMCSLLFLC